MVNTEPFRDTGSGVADGRRQRSDRSRQKIIRAMFDLLNGGDMSPSAMSVAKKAGVGLRSVFRHFEDMDGIYHEMTDQLLASVRPKVLAPLTADTWQGRLFESAERRAEIYEEVFPMRMCMGLRRHQSAFLMDRHERDLALERSSLEAILPEDVMADPVLFAAIETTLGFPNWERLRKDLSLSPEEAGAVIQRMLTALVTSGPG